MESVRCRPPSVTRPVLRIRSSARDSSLSPRSSLPKRSRKSLNTLWWQPTSSNSRSRAYLKLRWRPARWCRGSRCWDPQAGDGGSAQSGTHPASPAGSWAAVSTKIATNPVPERVALDPLHHVVGHNRWMLRNDTAWRFDSGAVTSEDDSYMPIDGRRSTALSQY